MSSIPIWAWGTLGGLILGCIGLLILLPGCTRGARALLTRFVISLLTKLILAGVGFWVAIKVMGIQAAPLAYGFLVGYVISLFLEIIPCIWKLRRWTSDATSSH